jgi:hypothetical protein
VKLQADNGEAKEMFFADDNLFGWFEDKPDKIISIDKSYSRVVSKNQFLDDVMIHDNNVPTEGIPVKIKYNPTLVKDILFIHRVDGDITEMSYAIPVKTTSAQAETLRIKEVSRDDKTNKIKYSYEYLGNPPDIWYVVDANKGKVQRYVKDGERFIAKEGIVGWDKPDVKLKEEFNKPGIVLLNFKQNQKGSFEASFSSSKEMVENSYLIESNLKQYASRDSYK